LPQSLRNIRILEFRHRPAFSANQKLHGMMPMICFRAGDKRIQPFQPMDKMVLDQKIQRPVHGRRHGALANLAQLVEQLISRQRPFSLQNQRKDKPPQFR